MKIAVYGISKNEEQNNDYDALTQIASNYMDLKK